MKKVLTVSILIFFLLLRSALCCIGLVIANADRHQSVIVDRVNQRRHVAEPKGHRSELFALPSLRSRRSELVIATAE